MEIIKSYGEYLNEAKNTGTLYHYTSLKKLINILKSETLYSQKRFIELFGEKDFNFLYHINDSDYFISFTRNKNYHITSKKSGVAIEVIVLLDGSKLSNKYKIKPIDKYPPEIITNVQGIKIKRNADKYYDKSENWKDEQEERINVDKIENIANYIIGIKILNKTKINNLAFSEQELLKPFLKIK